MAGTPARRLGLALLGAAAAGAALLLARPPVAGAYPLCPWRALTGLDCPFCGGTRAFAALVHGDVVAAADFNLLAAVAIAVVLLVALVAVVRGPRAQPMVDALFAPRTVQVGLAIVGVWWALRLLPFLPWLASGA